MRPLETCQPFRYLPEHTLGKGKVLLETQTCLVHIGRGALREEVAEGFAVVRDVPLNLHSAI